MKQAVQTLPHAASWSEGDCLLTVPQASRHIGVCERTLRHALREPAVADQVLHGSRKVGTFYKTVQLLPPTLVAHLAARLKKQKRSAVSGKHTEKSLHVV